MLEAKLKLLTRVFNGHPFGFARQIIYPRPHLGIPDMNDDTELEGSKAVERVVIDDALKTLSVAKRDLDDIEGDIVALREARDAFLRCLLCHKYMKRPLFVNRCNHAFCQPCLVQYLQQQREQYLSHRHRCPAQDCEQLMHQEPRPIPMVSTLASAIYFATCGVTGQSVREWCSDEPSTFEGLFM